jgi:molybdopterin converting factor small subunit
MILEVRCFAVLAQHAPPDNRIETPDGINVEMLMKILGITPSDVKLIFINGTHKDAGDTLNNNDRVSFIPAVGGG